MRIRPIRGAPSSVAAVLTVLLSVLLAVPPLAHASRQGRAKPPVALVIESVDPKTVRPGSTINLTGHLRNQSGRQIDGLSVRLRWRDRPLTGRAELALYAGNAAPALTIAGPSKRLNEPLTATGQLEWRLEIGARQLGMTHFGVHPVAVEVVNAAGQSVVTQTTFLVFLPRAKAAQPLQTRIAWVWPMIDRPHRADDETFVDDRLETDLASTGRLGALARAARTNTRTPVTWAIDPALLDDVQEMTNGYPVKNSRQPKGVGMPESKAAQTWLAEVKAAGAPYFTTPYADPDAVALVRQKMSGHLSVAYRHMAIAKDVLGRPQSAAIGWPADGAAGRQTLDSMAAYGSESFLLSSEVLISQSREYTPSAATTLQTSRGARRALVYDATISNVISGDTRSPGAALLAEQRFLAETAMVTAELPNRPRTLVIAPRRHWNPGEDLAGNLLEYTAGAPWLKEVPLSDVGKAAPVPRTFIGYPAAYERHELGAAYLKKVREIGIMAKRFTGIFEPPVNTYERTILRMESNWWRDRGRQAHAFRQQAGGAVDTTIDKVHLVTNKRIGLAGRSGFIPVTVANDLTDRNVKVVLRVTSRKPQRLTIGGGVEVRGRTGTGREWELTIGPERKETVRIPVQAYANGYTDLALELLSPQQKRKFGEGRSITVHTTGYGQLALRITGGALAVLFIGVGMRVLRAKRQARRQGRSEGSDDAGVGRDAGA